MSLIERRRAVRRAERELEFERARWHARTRVLREHYVHHREAWLLGGGFGAGVIASLLPLRAGARLGRAITSMATLLLRSPIQALLLEAARRHLDPNHDPRTTTRTR